MLKVKKVLYNIKAKIIMCRINPKKVENDNNP